MISRKESKSKQTFALKTADKCLIDGSEQSIKLEWLAQTKYQKKSFN